MREAAIRNASRTTVTFGDVVRLSTERSANPESDGFERFVGLEHLEPRDLRVRRWGDIANGTTFTSVFRQGQVLFGKRRAYQRKVALADFSGVCSGDIYVLEPKGQELLPDLLPFICQTDAFFEHAVSTSSGSLSPRTNWTSLATFEFDLPPLEEQRRMTEALKASEHYLESLLHLEATSRALWLATAEAIETQFREELRPVGELLAAINPGRSVVGVDSPPRDGEYGVLKVSAVDPLGFQPHESKRLIRQAEFLPQHMVMESDLLMTRANTSALVGETCLVDRDYPNLMLSDKTLRLVPLSGISKTLLWHMLQSNRVRQQIEALATGTGGAMKNISQPKIEALRVCYPINKGDSFLVEQRLGECFSAFREAKARRTEFATVHSRLINVVISGGAG